MTESIISIFDREHKQNAEYIDEAMGIHPPHPTRKWDFCSDENLAIYMEGLRVTKPYYFELDAMCSGSLGFYLFRRFIHEKGEGYLADFLNDVAIFRMSPKTLRRTTAGKIIFHYLLDGSVGLIGRKSIILDVYSDRNLPPGSGSRHDTLPDLHAQNCLHVSGESLSHIFAVTGVSSSMDDWEASLTNTEVEMEIPGDLFDSLDITVFDYLKKQYFAEYQQSECWFKFFRLIEHSGHAVTVNDFSMLRPLGRGGFGIVKACKHKQTGKIFAAKVMNKKRVKLMDSSDLVLEERVVMSMVDSPYIVCLKYAFTTATDLYLILDLMTGGDLGFHLGKRGAFPPEECVYYAARTLMAIKSLHDLDIVYRDLKPENILMDENGYTRLSDFGLACRMRKKGLSEACGTRGYWAPEMLRRDSDGHKERYYLTVDWFSLGCIIYEFHRGVGPFRTEQARKWGSEDDVKHSKEETMDLATLQMNPEFDPEYFDENAIDLLDKLLYKAPSIRLGANGAEEVMRHPYFANIDFEHMEMIRPPFRPAKNINAAKTSEIGKFSSGEISGVSWTPEDEDQYHDWEYINIAHYQQELVGFMRYEEVLGKPIEPVNESPRQSCRSS